MVERLKILRIGVLGYTSELSVKGVKYIAENNQEQVKVLKCRTDEAWLELNDNTIIESINYWQSLRGLKYDQLILFDDERWDIEWAKSDIIQKIIGYCMPMSNVPEEYKIIKMCFE